MPELRTAMTVLEYIVGVLAALALGDYLGYKFGRKRLGTVLLIVFLVVIVAFAIYAGVVLA